MASTPAPVTNLKVVTDQATSVTLSWTAATQLVVVPGGQSFQDNAGNVWRITAAGAVTENGKAIPGGSGTSALTYRSANNIVYGQDAASKIWWLWDGTNWHQTIGSPVTPLVGVVYSVKYRVHGTVPWRTFPTTTTGTLLTVTGLTPRTVYDMEVLASGN